MSKYSGGHMKYLLLLCLSLPAQADVTDQRIAL